MPQIAPPTAGQPTQELWRIVAQLCDVVNGLQTMNVIVSGSDELSTGDLKIQGDQVTLHIY